MAFLHKRFKRYEIAAVIFICVTAFLMVSLHVAYADKIYARVYIGTVSVGGMSSEQALGALEDRIGMLAESGIRIRVEGEELSVRLEDFGFEYPVFETVEEAMHLGREGYWYTRLFAPIRAFIDPTFLRPDPAYDQQALESQIDVVAEAIDQPRKDIRLLIIGTNVEILTDIKPGAVLDREAILPRIVSSLRSLSSSPLVFDLKEDPPISDFETAEDAKLRAERMISEPIFFEYDEGTIVISREKIGSWIISTYEDKQLVPAISNRDLSTYIVSFSQKVSREPKEPKLSFIDGRVDEFVPPHPGRVVRESELIESTIEVLEKRRDENTEILKTAIVIPFRTTSTGGNLPENLEGITELLGKATTPFTGSPPNRIGNIKNGVKFLSGILIPQGAEFSVIERLGKIDNTTGYLPELVIKGDETIPEFGGGLCQVSTTMFRAVLDAGLPILERQNHSYRVSYYEKDGSGQYIGPGLDATIYQPKPDLKFKNDTGASILVYGYVSGTKVTFELYGTSDGRVAEIIGPKLLYETPPGDPIYIETDKLAKGTTKRIETPHAGGSATMTYRVTYPDNSVEEEEFKSWYRPWPAKYLVGTRE